MDQKGLEDLICELYEIEEVTSLIKNQISKFKKQHGYSYKDIGRAFYYYVKVLGREAKLSGGIGIVPYYMEDATRFFEAEILRIKEAERQAESFKKAEKVRKEIKVKEVKRESRGIKKMKL